MARAVNFVWNYCNDVSIQYLDKQGKWLSGFDLNRKTSGCSKELGLVTSTIQDIGQEYARKRKQFKKRKLSWRGKKSLAFRSVIFSGVTLISIAFKSF